jgi:hypothetical protein
VRQRAARPALAQKSIEDCRFVHGYASLGAGEHEGLVIDFSPPASPSCRCCWTKSFTEIDSAGWRTPAAVSDTLDLSQTLKATIVITEANMRLRILDSPPLTRGGV